MTQVNQTILAVIDWYREMGADEVLDATPVDWLEGPARVPGAQVLEQILSSVGPGAISGLGESSGPGVVSGGALDAPGQGSLARSGGGTTGGGARSARGPGINEPTIDKNGAQVAGRPVGRSFETPAPDASLAAAHEAVASVSTLSVLHERLLAFDGCGLKATAKNTCFYRGAQSAKIMIIGEAPGRDEDLEGRPFVGRAGQMLDLMLKAVDLGQKSVHITNVVYWRPPGNRTPTDQEMRVCRPFLETQVRLVDPEIVVLLGGAAAKNLLDTTQGIMRTRGKWREVMLGGAKRKVLASLHPAYLLRTPAAKRLAWRDFLAIKVALSQLD